MTEPFDAPVARPISARREFAIIIVLSLLAVSTIAIASATNSYVPLFFAWLPYLGIPLVVSRLDRSRPALVAEGETAAPATDATSPSEAAADGRPDEAPKEK